MALTWPENPRLIGTRITRLDGLAKASGRAKYPSDQRPDGTLFAVMLYSPYAHAKVTSIDTSAAEKMPGVKAVTAIAKGDGPDKLTVWASTQAVQVVAGELADAFSIPTANVTVLTDYMGGGFGSKFGADVWGRTAAELAKKSGRPVTLFLDRVQEHLAAGNRPSAAAKVKLGASKDGRIVAMIAETHGTGCSRGGSNFPLPYVYDVPASSRTHSEVFVNGGGARAMRAPGHPQGCALMEAAMDDLADKLGMDPPAFRLKNLAPGAF